MVTPEQRRAAVTDAMTTAMLSERQACRFTGFARSTQHYRTRRPARRPSLGDATLFPSVEDVTKPIRKEIAGHWLTKAETKAKLDHMERGGYHQFRRLWAQTVFSVVDFLSGGPTSDTAKTEMKQA